MGASSFLQGSIDEVAVYGSALPASRIVGHGNPSDQEPDGRRLPDLDLGDGVDQVARDPGQGPSFETEIGFIDRPAAQADRQ